MTSYILLGILVQAFIFTIMLAIGLQISIEELRRVFQKKEPIIKSLGLNLVLAPIVAFLVLKLIGITGPVATAVLLLAVSPGAPFAPRIVEIGKGDLPFVTTAVVLFSIIAVFSAPITAQLFFDQGEQGFSIPWRLILLLLVFQLLPLSIGLWVNHRRSKTAGRLVRPLHILSNLLIISLAILAIYKFGEQFWQLRFTDWLTLLTVTLTWMALGALQWSNGPMIRHTEILLLPARNIGLALFLALQGLGDTAIVIPLLAQGAISLFVVPAVGRVLFLWRSN